MHADGGDFVATPFLDTYEQLIRNGYSPLPIIPGTKRPLPEEWETARDEVISPDLIAAVADKHPASGVGVAGGYKDLAPADIDAEDPAIVAAILACLPASPVGKRGQRGKTLFYRSKCAARKIRAADGRMLFELLPSGQVVIPPSVHPDTKAPYVWTTPDTLLTVPVEDLPVITEEHLAAVEKALEPYTEAKPTEHVAPLPRSEDSDRIRSALAAIPSDDRDVWVRVGMAIQSELGDAGFALWREWSMSSIKFDEADTRAKWKSFGKKGGVGIATVFHLAAEHGWREERKSVTLKIGGKLYDFSAPPGANATEASDDAPLEFDDEISLETKITAIVKGVLYPGEVGAIYGPSGVGKSFAAIDLCYHLAHGLDWHGRKVPAKTVVLLVSLEGVRGTRHRMYAYAGYLGNAGRMLARLTVHTPLDRSEAGQAGEAAIIANAKALAEKAGQPVGLIVIDTLARAIAGDDENSTQDMNAFVTRVSAIARATGSAVLVVHHTGKDDSRGMRGSSTLFAACDLVLKIADQGGTKVVTAEKVKDGETGDLFAYRLDRKVLGYDDDNEEITSCIVKRTDAPNVLEGDKLTPNQATMLGILRDAKSPLATEDWYEMTRKSGIGRNRPATLFDIRTSLQKKGLVYEGMNGWIVKCYN